MAEVTHARIKYLTDDYVDIVPVENIIQFQKHKPKHKDDFDRSKVYNAIYSDEKNPTEIILQVQISDLACGIPEVIKLEMIRPKFVRLNTSDIPNTSCDNESH